MKRCLYFLLFILHTLAAEEEQDFSLVNLTKSPIPRVAGTVNIVTGNWVDQSIHQETSGPDPYIVGHSYISSSLEEGSLADGWDLYHPSELEVYQPNEIFYVDKSVVGTLPEGVSQNDENIPFTLVEKGSYREKGKQSRPPKPQKSDRPPRDHYRNYYLHLPKEDNDARLFYREAGGAMYLFKGDGKAKHFHPKIHKTGYSHISSIVSPSRRDMRRTEVNWDEDHDEWVVKLGDGTKRTYARTDRHRHRPVNTMDPFRRTSYHIREEVLPSGNRRWFHYDSDKELASIQTVSSDQKYVLHFVEFHRKHDSVEVKTSEGLSTHFSLKKLHDRENAHVVDKIDRPTKGKLTFSYCDKSSRHTRRIYEKSLGNGRKDTAKFYHEGKNEVGEDVVHISNKKKRKFLENRVREIWTKQFAGGKSLLSHAFTYKDWDTHGQAKVKELDGATTAYMWDTEHPVLHG